MKSEIELFKNVCAKQDLIISEQREIIELFFKWFGYDP